LVVSPTDLRFSAPRPAWCDSRTLELRDEGSGVLSVDASRLVPHPESSGNIHRYIVGGGLRAATLPPGAADSLEVRYCGPGDSHQPDVACLLVVHDDPTRPSPLCVRLSAP